MTLRLNDLTQLPIVRRHDVPDWVSTLPAGTLLKIAAEMEAARKYANEQARVRRGYRSRDQAFLNLGSRALSELMMRELIAAAEEETRGFAPYRTGPGVIQGQVRAPFWGGSGVAETREAEYEAQAVPVRDEPVRAWRAWYVSLPRKGKGGPVLRSVTYGTQWPAGRAFHGRCIKSWQAASRLSPGWKGHHHAPQRECQCGVYAKTTPSGAADWAQHWHSRRPIMWPVIGLASLWGRVLLYQQGYRAEYAYPYHLFIPESLTPRASAISFDLGWTQAWDGERLGAHLRNTYAVDVTVVPFNPPDIPEQLRERNPHDA